MVILYKNGEKTAFETEINREQKDKLVEKRNQLTVFNEKNYYEVGESRTFNPDPSIYSELGDYYYIPFDQKKYGYYGIEINRKVYCSYYKDTLRLIASILKGKPKIIDLTEHIKNDFESVIQLQDACDILEEKINSCKDTYSEEDNEFLKRNLNVYKSIIECLSYTTLIKSKIKIKE